MILNKKRTNRHLDSRNRTTHHQETTYNKSADKKWFSATTSSGYSYDCYNHMTITVHRIILMLVLSILFYNDRTKHIPTLGLQFSSLKYVSIWLSNLNLLNRPVTTVCLHHLHCSNQSNSCIKVQTGSLNIFHITDPTTCWSMYSNKGPDVNTEDEFTALKSKGHILVILTHNLFFSIHYI